MLSEIPVHSQNEHILQRQIVMAQWPNISAACSREIIGDFRVALSDGTTIVLREDFVRPRVCDVPLQSDESCEFQTYQETEP